MDEAQINAIVDEILSKLPKPLHEYNHVLTSLAHDKVVFRVLVGGSEGWVLGADRVPGKRNAQRVAAILQDTLLAARRLKEATNDSRPTH